MKPVIRSTLLTIVGTAVLLGARPATAKTDGILVLGTQAEVRNILKGSHLELNFSEENPSALVAVRLSHGELATYEHDAVQQIVKFVGKLAEGGVVITLKVGSAFWDLLEDVVHCAVQVGEAALKAACWVLSHAKCVIVDGVTWTLKTAADVLEAVADLLQCIFHSAT